MGEHAGYRIQRLSGSRLALIAGQELARRRHLMYALVRADLTRPLRRMAAHRLVAGQPLSLAGYVAVCLGRALREFPELNAFRRGRSLVLLDEVIVVVLLERTIAGQPAVGYLPIRHADSKSLVEVTAEIRYEQRSEPAEPIPARWLERLPVPLLRWLLWWASHDVRWALRYGVAGVNNVGAVDRPGGWGLAPGAGTIAVLVGGIEGAQASDGGERRVANLTVSFDHDVVDGAPAARFTARLLELLASGEVVPDAVAQPFD